MNACERIADRLRRSEAQVFMIDASTSRTLTYGEFHRASCAFALRLRDRGIGHGSRVALLLNNSLEFAALYFAALYLGATAVPVNPSLHPKDIRFILDHSNASLVVYAPSTRALLEGTGASLPRALLVPRAEAGTATGPGDLGRVEDPSPETRGWEPLSGVSPDDLFTITFTSGTTSRPKGVPHRIRSLVGSAEAFGDALGFQGDTRLYHVLPMAYMAGFLNTLLCPYLAGGSVIVHRSFDASLALEFWETAIRHRATAFWLVPTILATLVKIDRHPSAAAYARNNLRSVCVGTAPLPFRLKEEFERKYGVTVQESYGLSETLFVTTNAPNRAARAGSVGPALPGVRLEVVDDQGAPVPVGRDGEIRIVTPWLMAGYLDYATSAPDPLDPEHPFATGDTGQIDAEGWLRITGRKKDLIIRGGTNISPRQIEEVLLESEAVDQVAVIGLPHEFYGEEIAAVIKLKPGHDFAAVLPSLVERCRGNLSPVAVPSRFIPCDGFPTTSNGKIQKGMLREQLAGRTGPGGGPAAAP